MAARSIGRRHFFVGWSMRAFVSCIFPEQRHNNYDVKWWAYIYFHIKKSESFYNVIAWNEKTSKPAVEQVVQLHKNR
jgi:hypothetical protein